jgi:hypothetical protein
VGVAWYGPEAWARLREAVPDPELLLDSHAEWVEMALDACAKLDGAGFEVTRVEVDPAELLDWCREQGIPADAGARANFAVEKLRERELAGEKGANAGRRA